MKGSTQNSIADVVEEHVICRVARDCRFSSDKADHQLARMWIRNGVVCVVATIAATASGFDVKAMWIASDTVVEGQGWNGV